MLGKIKKLMKSFLGGIVLLIIIVGMAVWGIEDIFRGNLGGSMVEAGSRSLSAEGLDRRVENVLRNINATADQPLSKNEAIEQGIVDQVFAMETSKIANMGYAARIGAVPPDEKVIEKLQEETAFANPLTGEFDLNMYRDVLSRNQLTPQIYQQQIQDDISLAFIRNASSAAIASPDLLTTLQASYIGETRDVSYFLLGSDDTAERAEPTDEELAAFYEENQSVFKQPERRAIDLIKISTDDFLSKVTVTDEEISKVYEATKLQRFSAQDTRTILQLTFASRETARTALGFLAGGRSPDSLTNTIARDTLTGTRAIMADDELAAEALFGPNTGEGALFGPKQDEDGNWQLWQVQSVQPGDVFPLESVTPTIREELSRERAEAMFFDTLNTFDNAIGAGFALKEIASELSVPYFSFEPVDASGFTKSGTPLVGLLEAQDAFRSAFEYGEGELGDRYDGDTAVYIAATREIIPESTPELSDIRDQVLAYYQAQTASQALQDKADEVEASINNGALTMQTAAEQAGTTLETLQPALSRTNAEQSGLPSAAIAGIFSGQEGDILMFPARAGDQMLILQISNINRPDSTALEAYKTSAAASLTESIQQDLQVAMETEIRTAVDLKTNGASLNAYKTSITSEQ